MVGFLLDTNIPSELAKPLPDARVSGWIDAHRESHLSVISMGELHFGLSLMAAGRRRLRLEAWFDRHLPAIARSTLPVTRAIAERWGVISAERQRLGKPLNSADGLIAATALEYNFALVTRNVKDFVDLGLTLINPWEL